MRLLSSRRQALICKHLTRRTVPRAPRRGPASFASHARYPRDSQTHLGFSLWIIAEAGNLSRPVDCYIQTDALPNFDPIGARIPFSCKVWHFRATVPFSRKAPLQRGVCANPPRLDLRADNRRTGDRRMLRGINVHCEETFGRGRQDD
jgi:hypothetical protein